MSDTPRTDELLTSWYAHFGMGTPPSNLVYETNTPWKLCADLERSLTRIRLAAEELLACEGMKKRLDNAPEGNLFTKEMFDLQNERNRRHPLAWLALREAMK